MYPTAVQEQQMLLHCAHARYVWNLAVEQHSHWQKGRRSAPGFAEHASSSLKPALPASGCALGTWMCSSKRSRTSPTPSKLGSALVSVSRLGARSTSTKASE
ncbi:helix-turn-helix domain-containing protein [Saccharopolyspora erythraea]|uniref:helix-turn-helix domain-containing protein n=1 Tax=Saccharopolyspora erythraea TaxID=1836 RepID=UPI0039F1ABBE